MNKEELPDDPPDQYEDLYDKPLNIAVYFAFNDVAPDIAESLIALLESHEPITHHVRQEIAEALKAGLSTRFANPRQAQLCVTNDGGRKKGHPRYRTNKRQESIDRAKLLESHKHSLAKTGLGATLGAMTLAGIETPVSKLTGKPVSQRTLDNDMALFNFMREWIEKADDLPFFIRLSKKFDLAAWQASEQAESDFVRWGPDKPKNWKVKHYPPPRRAM